MSDLAPRSREAALLEGDFVLSSGERSSFYIDKYLFSTEPDLLRDVAGALAEQIPEGVDRLAGVELGAVPLVVATALVTGLPYVIVRKAAKEHGSSAGSSIEGNLNRGETVVLIEDVVTTGGALLDACPMLRAEGAVVDTVVCAIDRQQGGDGRLGEAGLELRSALTRQVLEASVA